MTGDGQNTGLIHPKSAQEIGKLIDQILEPFHGRGSRVPGLPPAKVLVDFAEAIVVDRAA